MNEDKEILKEVWEGKIPICFRLSQIECGSNEPEDIYVKKIFKRFKIYLKLPFGKIYKFSIRFQIFRCLGVFMLKYCFNNCTVLREEINDSDKNYFENKIKDTKRRSIFILLSKSKMV